jgi:uncharacterized protein HemX
MDFLNTVIFPALATIVTGLVGWGISALVAWLNSKIKNEKVRAALENTRDIITAAVSETSQIFVDDLKKTGSFTDALKAEAFEKTMTLVKKQLTKEAEKLIKTTTNDLDVWLCAEIEKAVKNGKTGG